MNEIQEKVKMRLSAFRLPIFKEIPDNELYLEQVVQYISMILKPLGEGLITASMISNYVKKKLVDRPVRKFYYRSQIAYLLYITLTKTVFSLDQIGWCISLQKAAADRLEESYEFFRKELERVLHGVCAVQNYGFEPSEEENMAKAMFFNMIVAIANHIYLEQCYLLMEANVSPQGIS